MDEEDRAGPFRRIIEPLDPATFAAEIWERRPMVFRGGPRRFQDFGVDLERFERALGELPPGSLRANRIDGDGIGHYFQIAAADFQTCFAQEQTICATNLQLGFPRLVDLARDTRRTLGLAGPVIVNAYLSPAARGFGLHLDTQSVFILQLEGEKHWLHGAGPAAAFPPEGMDAYPDSKRERFRRLHPQAPLTEPRDCEWRQCRLRPGDALYLPAGTWHQGTAGEHSLALTLTCVTLDFSFLLTPMLHQGLFASEGWRRNLPCQLAAEGGSSKEAFIAERLDELRRWLDRLSPSDVARRWEDILSAQALPPS